MTSNFFEMYSNYSNLLAYMWILKQVRKYFLTHFPTPIFYGVWSLNRYLAKKIWMICLMCILKNNGDQWHDIVVIVYITKKYVKQKCHVRTLKKYKDLRQFNNYFMKKLKLLCSGYFRQKILFLIIEIFLLSYM